MLLESTCLNTFRGGGHDSLQHFGHYHGIGITPFPSSISTQCSTWTDAVDSLLGLAGVVRRDPYPREELEAMDAAATELGDCAVGGSGYRFGNGMRELRESNQYQPPGEWDTLGHL